MVSSHQKDIHNFLRGLSRCDFLPQMMIWFMDSVTIYAIFLGIEKGGERSEPTVIEELCGTVIKKIVEGDRFMVVLTESGEIYTSGLCEDGRCGNGRDSSTYCKPKKILAQNQFIIDVSCCEDYTLLLTDKQQVYAFGSLNIDGRIQILSPTLISELQFEKISSISCGYDHVLALTKTGKVYAWGNNHFGELGLGHNNDESKPKLVEMPNNVSVKQISCGTFFSLILTTGGTIYSFGTNHNGQLGHDHKKHFNIPTLMETRSKFTEILAFDSQSFAMNEKNRIEFWGFKFDSREDISFPEQTNAVSLQEAIIFYIVYPFPIEPIILNEYQENLIKSKKGLPLDLRTMFELFNNPTNNDFKFKIKRQECDEPNESCLSDDQNNGYDIIYCHKWIVEQRCDYLKKLFTKIKSIKESNEMEIKGFSYETYFYFFKYLYTNSFETKNFKLLNEILLLSDMYSEVELKARCVSLIKPLLNFESLFERLFCLRKSIN